MVIPGRSIIVSLSLCAVVAPAQEMQPSSTLMSLVNTEHAFARASSEKGMDSAFVSYLADDAIIFRPHPVNGQKWFHSHPAPPILLTWMPGFADVASAGDLGYTTGPWMLRDRADTTGPAEYGEFVTVWRRERGNIWRVVLDAGVSHPAPTSDISFSSPMGGLGTPSLVRPDSTLRATAWSALLGLERDAFGDSLRVVPVADVESLLDSNVRFLRPGRYPIVGVDSVKEFLGAHPGSVFRCSMGGDLSRSGDLGYTYGAYHFRAREAAGERQGYYLTVWKKKAEGHWSIVLDLESILPKRE
jgi:ketosteroid isomerase-like protein